MCCGFGFIEVGHGYIYIYVCVCVRVWLMQTLPITYREDATMYER